MVATLSPKEIFSFLFLSLVGQVQAQSNENCTLQDGRRCQYSCFEDPQQETYCICSKGYELQSDKITCESILEVYSIYPTFGPVSGGTLVTIRGRNLLIDSQAQVTLGSDDVICEIMPNSTNSRLYIYTPDVHHITASPNQKLEVSVFHQNSQLRAKSPLQFTFKPDPIVKSIKPVSSILSGGIQLTISGEDMLSVAEPKLNIYVIANSRHLKTFTSGCTLSTNTTFYCASPDMSNLPNLLNTTSYSSEGVQYYPGLTLDGVTRYDYNSVPIPRMSRPTDACSFYTSPRTTMAMTMASSTTSRGVTGIPGRPDSRPGIPGPPGFPTGYPTRPTDFPTFRTEGPPGPEFPTTAMETTTLWYPIDCPVCTSFIVFPNPTIHLLIPEEIRFRPYGPFNHKYITIKGKDLDRGLTRSDYRVFIGASVCEDITLSSTLLICIVADGKPKKQEFVDDIMIVVQIGVSESNKFYVGKLTYEENLWYYKPARDGFIALIIIVPLLSIVIFILVKVFQKSRTDHRRNWFVKAAQKQHEAKPGGMEINYLHPIKETSTGMEKHYLHPIKASTNETQETCSHLPIETSGDGMENYLHPIKASTNETQETCSNLQKSAGSEENYLYPQNTRGDSYSLEANHLHPINSADVDKEYLQATTGSAPA